MNIAAPLRWTLGLVFATGVTLLLLKAMQALVTSDEMRLNAARERFTLDFVRVQPVPEVSIPPRQQPERPAPPPAAPPPPPAPAVTLPKPTVSRLAIAPRRFEIELPLTAEGFSLGAAEGEFLPMVKVAPVYPRRALSRGVEGDCLVEYTVTEAGTTRDVRVVESQCSSVLFHDASIRAAQKFRYQPRVRDGRRVEVQGVRNLFRFRIEPR